MIWSSFFLPHKKVRGQKKKPSFNGDFYRKNVLKPLLKEVNRRTEDTDDLLTINLLVRGMGLATGWRQTHTAKATMKMLREKFPDIIEDWPPNSPDLNLIENLWAILTEKVYQVDCTGVRSLKQRIRKCWREMINPETLRALVEDMPNRIQLVIEAKGGAFDM